MKNKLISEAHTIKQLNKDEEALLKQLAEQSRKPMDYELMILKYANKHGLGSLREESIEKWFKLIQFFEAQSQPSSNVMLWYIAGLKNSVEKLTDGGLENSDTVKYEKIRIEQARKLMFDISNH